MVHRGELHGSGHSGNKGLWGKRVLEESQRSLQQDITNTQQHNFQWLSFCFAGFML
jgi:hypothetical protein